MIVAFGRPLPLHQGPRFGFVHPALPMIAVEERRNPPVGDAMDVNRGVAGFKRRDESAVMLLLRDVERHRDMGIEDAMPGQLAAFVRERVGMVVQRQVDHVPCTHFGKPGHILVLDTPGRGDLRRNALPGANVVGIAHANPSTRAALSFMIPGMTSSRKPTSCAAAIHLSGWISGKSLPNSILCLSWVLAY